MKDFRPDPKPEKTPKKAKKPLKRTAIKYKPKNTGQVSTFEQIATERPWVCFVSDKTFTQLKSNQFLHVLPKAANRYPLFKTYSKNIVLAADEIHEMWDTWPRSKVRLDKRFDKLFELEAELIEEYKQLHG